MNLNFKKEENSPQPLYQQVAEWMQENIRAGHWAKGDKLPAEEDLAKEIGISRGTLRNAIALLIKQGLLIQVQGKGTFVEKDKISYPFAQELISFAESMEVRGIDFETKVVEKQIVKPNQVIQKKLQIDASDDVLYLKRVRYIQNQPATLLKNWVSLKRCPGIEQTDFSKISLFNAIEEATESKIHLGIRNFSATKVTEDQAAELALDVDDPVLFIDQVTFADEKVPLECSQVLLRTDKYEVTSVLTR